MAQLSNNDHSKYDLEERTAKFAEGLIDFMRTISETAINSRIITQLTGAAGSVGANYCEATEAESKKDFIHKIGICKKEIKESRHWLRLLAKSNPERVKEIREFWKEAQELLLIFSKISRSSKV
ncbi:MAG: four helix bundle protein [Candidatus Wildermuthbacteria bacterium GWA2_46_15]|uniref:Four helix bundle protein n=1 Tax=Candidatus Wildermuthbacteria bacterium GWA2_46_15 TaxID=1802443 RepID=A0A1G2QQ89_9BACT|nr:MAG: four helix bundle protein [Candidatus Wildermuthbacteria bacterium GWA2_46_15]